MNESEFISLSEFILENISEILEENDQDSQLDIEYNDGILEIEIIDQNKKYVINRNSGNKKIWLSSPFTGADYFSYNYDQKKWFNDNNIELGDKLFNELKFNKINLK
jgi:iron donor protein CyaY